MGQPATTSSQVFKHLTKSCSLSKSRGHSFGIVAATPENIDDLEMKKVVLRNFSDIATPMEAAQKLRNMRMTSDQTIASYNYNYAAVHEAAFDIHPSEQRMRFATEDYANSYLSTLQINFHTK